MKDYLFVAIMLLLIFAVVYSIYRNGKDLKKSLKLKFGAIPDIKYEKYIMDQISIYWREKSKFKVIPYAVDDTTWSDLDMDKVFLRINNTSSSIGEEYLYCTLREQEYDNEKLTEFENMVQYFDDNANDRMQVQYRLARLGKEVSNNLIEFLFNSHEKTLKNYALYPLLFVAAVLSIFSAFLFPPYGIIFFVLMLIVNIFVYYKTKANLQANFLSVHYLSALMVCAKKISRIQSDGLSEYADKIKKLYAPLKTISRLSGAVISKPSSELEFIFEYIKMFFLIDFVFYNFMISAVSKHKSECIEIYEIIGFLDTAISVASYRNSVNFFVKPVFSNKSSIEMQSLIHPLLENAVSNNVVISRNSLITGSNASGKSTFVKALAINMILAQTIHTVLAKKISLIPSFVVTSMAVKDDVEAGESYYIAEIKSLKRILNLLNDRVRCVAFVDEILKGTNTVERIAASAAILDYMKDKNCLSIIATHDIELTEMTEEFFDNFHFQEHITEDGIFFDYKIYPGKATTKNAIKLLAFTGFPQRITENAEKTAGEFEINKIWRKI